MTLKGMALISDDHGTRHRWSRTRHIAFFSPYKSPHSRAGRPPGQPQEAKTDGPERRRPGAVAELAVEAQDPRMLHLRPGVRDRASPGRPHEKAQSRSIRCYPGPERNDVVVFPTTSSSAPSEETQQQESFVFRSELDSSGEYRFAVSAWEGGFHG
uniref:Uncharacterized protein n=1 Tax=Vitis vinifera TaxID=29760 RepID=A5AZT9_VITVI|nr:hypothetical protein VITISV_035535 [Vitis vinifera]